MASHTTKVRSPLCMAWSNRSLCSINSEAPTIQSAHLSPQIELHTSVELQETEAGADKKSFEATKMERSDSGYADGNERRSTSSGRRSTSRRQTPSTTSTLSSTRPKPRRASKSSPSTYRSSSSTRPTQYSHVRSSSSRQTPSPSSNPSYQYVHFPSLADSSSSDIQATPSQPPPATVHYWTSEETRRLEYAAIDAASRGIRGFLTRLVPDCILPASHRRTKFHDDGADSDAGSVRRYRLSFPEEKLGDHEGMEQMKNGSENKRPGLLRRWTSFGRRAPQVQN